MKQSPKGVSRSRSVEGWNRMVAAGSIPVDGDHWTHPCLLTFR
ncbi:hypothetical protein [Paludibaculum fermentans]